MAADRKGVGSCSDPSNILVQVPHFYKVVMFPFDQGLKIPDAFTRKYGGDLQETVLLKVPNGRLWPVETVHYGNGSFLGKGWPEFAEFYSIKMFHFLVFRYEGNSTFHVMIFDPTAVEIEYPSKKVNGKRSGSLSQTLGQRGSPCVGMELNADDDVEEEILSSYQTTPCSSKGKRARVGDIEDETKYKIFS